MQDLGYPATPGCQSQAQPISWLLLPIAIIIWVPVSVRLDVQAIFPQKHRRQGQGLLLFALHGEVSLKEKAAQKKASGAVSIIF